MIEPTYHEEERLKKRGYLKVAGLDEAGRGAWAGPIVASGVILNPRIRIEGLRDSKQLTPTRRKQIYLEIVKNALNWSVGIVPEQTIDRIGINEANALAMEQAVKKLLLRPDYLLVDYFLLDHVGIKHHAIVKGDQKVASIAAASIVAKVTRDYIMIAAHKDHPKYGFHAHKGYGTEYHHNKIKQHGLCKIHRISFSPMKDLV
ncbi:ribonuclease HII [Patescibacteria group bacterium]|nr:ribonuclease HII [Patescibacteria group bacterium]